MNHTRQSPVVVVGAGGSAPSIVALRPRPNTPNCRTAGGTRCTGMLRVAAAHTHPRHDQDKFLAHPEPYSEPRSTHESPRLRRSRRKVLDGRPGSQDPDIPAM